MQIEPTDLVQFISNYVKLAKGRKILKGNCPFHNDQSESFMVYPARAIFKCFGCGLEGGLTEFTEAIKERRAV
jgi:DNA primase